MKVTITTAFFDIGRSQWNRFSRDTSTYLQNWKNTLTLPQPIVVYTSAEFIPFVKEQTKDRNDVYIVETTLQNSDTYKRFYEPFSKLHDNPNYAKGHWNPHTPEITNPLYALINLSKIEWIKNTINLNPFNSEYFIWIDAGYTHNSIPLSSYYFTVQDGSKFSANGLADICQYTLEEYQNQQSINDIGIDGGYIGVGKEWIERYYSYYYDTIEELTEKNGTHDDDQYYISMIWKIRPEIMNIVVTGRWFGALDSFAYTS